METIHFGRLCWFCIVDCKISTKRISTYIWILVNFQTLLWIHQLIILQDEAMILLIRKVFLNKKTYQLAGLIFRNDNRLGIRLYLNLLCRKLQFAYSLFQLEKQRSSSRNFCIFIITSQCNTSLIFIYGINRIEIILFIGCKSKRQAEGSPLGFRRNRTLVWNIKCLERLIQNKVVIGSNLQIFNF